MPTAKWRCHMDISQHLFSLLLSSAPRGTFCLSVHWRLSLYELVCHFLYVVSLVPCNWKAAQAKLNSWFGALVPPVPAFNVWWFRISPWHQAPSCHPRGSRACFSHRFAVWATLKCSPMSKYSLRPSFSKKCSQEMGIRPEEIFPQRRHANGSQTHGRVLNKESQQSVTLYVVK